MAGRAQEGSAEIQRAPGRLVIVGGGEDRRGERTILRRFTDLAGGPDARIVVIGTATTVPDDVGPAYLEAFADLVGEVDFLPVGSRDEANSAETLSLVEKATGVYFTGGDQLRIASIIGGSQIDVHLHAAYADGLVVGGTSAGAAMMSSTMIIGGGDSVPATDGVRLGPGLELLHGVVIDMHFAERGRLGRLLAAVAQFPHELGVGIDEDTALVVEGNRFEVVGRGAVTVVDAGAVTSLRTPGEDGTGPLAMTSVQLHVLPAGFSFDLSTRLPVLLDDRKDQDRDGGD